MTNSSARTDAVVWSQLSPSHLPLDSVNTAVMPPAVDLDVFSDVSELTPVPSSPLTELSRSPSPPPGFRLPSPPPSQDAGEDMPPPRKRRKIEPRIRTTQHLDLTSDTAQSDYDHREAVELLQKALRKRRKIVVIAGAGVSVSAGIPDFRSSDGLFSSLRGEHKLKSSGKELFDASVYKDDSSTSSFHDMVRKLSQMSANAKPTLFHRLLARLSTEGRLLRLYTQNVDDLEGALPPLATEIPLNHKAPWPQTIQLHGSLRKMMCQKCRTISDLDRDLFLGPTPPSCRDCMEKDEVRTAHAGKRSHGVGRLRPRMVLYNEQNPDEDAIGAVTTADLRIRPDAVVVVGTSMKIPAVKRITREMCRIVRDRREGTTIWINRDPLPAIKDLDDCWDLIVKGDSDEVARLADLKEWDDVTPDVAEAYTPDDLERLESSQGKLSVVVDGTPKAQKVQSSDIALAPTPPMSPMPNNVHPDPKHSVPPLRFVVDVPVVNPAEKLKNPASKGWSVKDVLSGKTKNSANQTETKQGKKSTKNTARGRRVTDSQSIVESGKLKVGKRISQQATVVTGKVNLSQLMGKNASESAQQSRSSSKKPDGEEQRSKPEPSPLSPRRDSQSNAQPSFFGLEVSRDGQRSILQGYSSTEASPAPETPPGMLIGTPSEDDLKPHLIPMSRTSSKNGDTISPNGNVPRDMTKLLNYIS